MEKFFVGKRKKTKKKKKLRCDNTFSEKKKKLDCGFWFLICCQLSFPGRFAQLLSSQGEQRDRESVATEA